MAFLPKDYKGEPETGKYMKFRQGENTFRVLSDAIVGMEYWKTKTVDGKETRYPVRLRSDEKVKIGDLEINEKTGELEMPKHFWALVVFNRRSETIQILEITQATIRKAITALDNSKKWGDIKTFDITVTREGEGFDTVYTTMPEPKEEVDEGIVALYESMDIKLDKLYEGGDPFGTEDKSEKIAKDAVKGGL